MDSSISIKKHKNSKYTRDYLILHLKLEASIVNNRRYQLSYSSSNKLLMH